MTDDERREYEASVARGLERDAEREQVAADVASARRVPITFAAMRVRILGPHRVVLRRLQVRSLDARDLGEFRTAGASVEMIDRLIELAADDHETRDVQIDFQAHTVTAID